MSTKNKEFNFDARFDKLMTSLDRFDDYDKNMKLYSKFLYVKDNMM